MRIISGYADIYEQWWASDLMLFEHFHDIPFFSEPFMLDRTIVTLCKSGQAQGQYNLKDITIKKNDFVVMFSDQLVSFTDISDDFEATAVMMSNDFSRSLKQYKTLGAKMFFQNHPFVHLSDEEADAVTHCLELMKFTIRLDSDDKREMVKSIFGLMGQLLSGLEPFGKSQEKKKLRHEEIFDRFYQLVMLHHRETRKITWYADKLFITPKYLSSVIKKTTGKASADWINEYVILGSKSLLKTQREMTVAQIAIYMGFDSLPTFCRLFKKMTGVTPTTYRESK